MATTYTVKKGDTLWDIAKEQLGSSDKWKQLAAINNIEHPDLIYVGQVIKLSNDSGSGSGSGSSSSSGSKSSSSNKPIIEHFGLQSNADNTLFATWSWNKSNTASYKVLWTYDTGDGVWFVGNNTTINVESDAASAARQSTYTIPANAKKVRFKVKPISKTYKKNNEDTNYWTASWSDVKTYTDRTPFVAPAVPTVTIEKYKLTASLDNVKISGATHIQFEVIKDNTEPYYKRKRAEIVSTHASYSWTVEAGSEYKVRARAYSESEDISGNWSDYSANVATIPSTPSGITIIRASSETSVYLEWDKSNTAGTYDIEYATKKEYLDGSNQTSSVSSIESTHYEITGLESGTEYFFRVRAVNNNGSSGWSDIKSIVIGKDPAAPTTWSSTTTAIVGEDLTLYWVHNAEDGSSQTYAEVEIYVDGVKETYTVKNSTDEEEKDKTSSYEFDTSEYVEGTKIQWRVRTAGITKAYGDWSVQRTVDIYAPPTLELSITDKDANAIEVLESFPFYIRGLAGPNTQMAVGYHLSITSNEVYETVDNLGNEKVVNVGEQVYSKYFDTNEALLVEFLANNIDLENNISYTATCIVSMDSGLTTEASKEFSVTWTDVQYELNASISIDDDSLTASIRPYCESRKIIYRKVNRDSGVYILTDESIESVWGEVVNGVKTLTGEQVYSGVTADGNDIYYCVIEESTAITDVLLSVYRREFDGSFTELAKDLDGAKSTTITDPHPALDFARYRLVAIAKDTGAVSFYDPPGYPVGCAAAVIQWDEEWSSFETSEEAEMEKPPWSGSLLKLPYNIDISDSNSSDVTLVKYIGRTHPVSYYGTHIGQTSTWNMVIEKDDEETLYALRRLAKWMGDVYVREPSGSGYWANVVVSFSQKHLELTIPVTLDITRVEGGM